MLGAIYNDDVIEWAGLRSSREDGTYTLQLPSSRCEQELFMEALTARINFYTDRGVACDLSEWFSRGDEL